MTRLRGMTLAAALVAGLTIPAVSLAAPSSADPAGHGPWQTYYEGPSTETHEDFCDVPGLTVDVTYADAIRDRWRILGPDDSPYNMYFADGYQKYTNVATGESVTRVGAGLLQEVRKTDNGDGTYTIHVTNKGNAFWYSDDGEILGRFTGAFSYTIVYDDNGTPSDFTDDVKIPPPTIVRNVGNKDDDCAIVVGAIG